jgi:plasmid maintenance system antidote protein VapI
MSHSTHPGSILLGEMLVRDWSLSEMAKQTGANQNFTNWG